MKKISLIVITIALLGLGYAYKNTLFNTVKQDLLEPASIHLGSLLQEDQNLPEPLQFKSTVKGSPLTVAGVVSQTNSERTKEKLGNLKINTKLTQAATAKIEDMFAKQYFEHISPTGIGPSDLDKAAGYEYIIVGENLALGNFQNDAALVEAWMNSPGHRANILNSKYQEIGVAVKQGMYQGQKVWLAVQEFGTPLSACPGVDLSVKNKIDVNKKEITTLQAQAEAQKTDLEKISQSNTAAYNKKVGEYNQTVQQINTLVEQTKVLVAQYNIQVDAFNACVNK